MTLEDIQKLEQARQSEDKYGVIHLLREANFWRAYDWSAWLMTSYPMGEANKPLNVSAKRAKNGNYWSSSLYSTTNGRYLGISGSGAFPQAADARRYLGFACRPVM